MPFAELATVDSIVKIISWRPVNFRDKSFLYSNTRFGNCVLHRSQRVCPLASAGTHSSLKLIYGNPTSLYYLYLILCHKNACTNHVNFSLQAGQGKIRMILSAQPNPGQGQSQSHLMTTNHKNWYQTLVTITKSCVLYTVVHLLSSDCRHLGDKALQM